MNRPLDDPNATTKALGNLTVPELKRRYAEVFGEPTRTNHKQYLVKRIVWRMQALREGGLSERARQRALELADDAEIRLSTPRAADDAQSAEPIAAMAAFTPTPRVEDRTWSFSECSANPRHSQRISGVGAAQAGRA